MPATNADRRYSSRTVFLWICAGAIWALAVLLSLRALHNHLPYFGLYQDDAIYVLTAKSIAQGDGYRILSVPGAPLQTKYPIFFPLMLSLVWKLDPNFPANVVAFESLSVLLALGFVTLATIYLIRTRRVTFALGIVIGGATILNIKFLSIAPMPMSDFAYGLASVAVLWMTEAVGRQYNQYTYRPVILALLNIMASLTRSAGAILVPITTGYLLLLRRWRAALVNLGVSASVLGAYWVWCRANQQIQDPFHTFYTSYSQWTLETYHDLGFAAVIAHKASDLFSAFMPLAWPMLASVPFSRLDALTFFLIYRCGYLVLWLLLLLGMGLELRQKKRCVLPAYVGVYLLGLATWPGFTEWRHLLLVMPFVYYFYIRAFRFIAARVKRLVSHKHRHLCRKIFSAAAVGFSIYMVAGSALPSLTRAGHYPSRLLHRPDLTSELEQQDSAGTYRWIRENTPPGTTFVCNNDALLYLYTGHTAMTPSPYEGRRSHSLDLISPQTLTESMKVSGADYLIIDPSYGGAYAVYDQLVLASTDLITQTPRLLTLVYRSPHDVMVVFKINKQELKKLASKEDAVENPTITSAGL